MSHVTFGSWNGLEKILVAAFGEQWRLASIGSCSWTRWAKGNDKSKVKPLSVDFPAVGSKQHCLLLLIDHAYTLLLMGKSLAGCCYDGLWPHIGARQQISRTATRETGAIRTFWRLEIGKLHQKVWSAEAYQEDFLSVVLTFIVAPIMSLHVLHLLLWCVECRPS